MDGKVIVVIVVNHRMVANMVIVANLTNVFARKIGVEHIATGESFFSVALSNL